MNHDYEGVFGRDKERRSRRNPKMQSATTGAKSGEELRREKEIWEERKRAAIERRKELDVMGDATVKPLKRVEPRIETAKETTKETTGTGRPRFKGEQSGSSRPRFKGEQAGSSRTSFGAAEPGSRASRAQVSTSASDRISADSARLTARQTAASGAPGSGKPDWQQALDRRKKKKRRRMITMIIAECFALLFIFGYGYVARQLNRLQRPDDVQMEEVKANNDLNHETVERMKGYWTIAVFGVDARDNAITKGTNADVNIIVNINRDTGEIKLVSLFRDTYLNISDKGTYNKFNQAYFLGGPEQAVKALNKNLDLDISDYMTFNWKAVADAINVLGGVDVELSKAEFYYINSFITETVKATGIGSHQLTHAGMNHLDGVQAVAYGRLRLMDTDYARTERQRKIIALAFEKAKKADFKTLNVLIGTVFPQVSTSIWVDDLVSNAKNISKFHLGETTGFPQARGDANMGKKGAVVVPQTLESNVVKLHEFLFGDTNYTPSQTVKDISAKIAADTGMYKEGNYVDKVGTGGGVIQPPKATKPAKTESEAATEDAAKESSKDGTKESTKESGDSEVETDENGDPIEETTEPETDENGDPIEETTEPETDENGDPIEEEPETDEDGNPLETSKGNGLKPTAPETDENGDPIETTRPTRPGETEESSSGAKPTKPTDPMKPTNPTKPTDPTKPTKPTRPGETEESSESTKPTSGAGNGGTTDRPGTGTGGSTKPGTGTGGVTDRPGSGTGTGGSGTTDRPGTGTGTGDSNTATRPGGGTNTGTGGSGTTNRPGSGGGTNNGGTGTTPGGGTGTGGSTGPNGPGSGGTSPIPAPPSGNGGPSAPGSGSGSSSGNSSGSGIVGGPGM